MTRQIMLPKALIRRIIAFLQSLEREQPTAKKLLDDLNEYIAFD